MILSLFSRQPDPDSIEVDHAGQRYRVALRRRPTARRITLRVSNATGEVTLTLPQKADLTMARAFADAHGGWIATKLAKRPVPVGFAHGVVIPVRDVPHRIMHWSTIRGVTQLTTDREGQPILAVAGEAAHVARRVQDFLRREALADLEKAVQRHCLALGLPARRITVRDTVSRWGSCSARGHLNFSWRLIMAPPFVLDYLAAHEVAHLKEMNHSHRFWNLLKRLCPRTDEAEAWLNRNGSGLHRYGSRS